MVRKSNIKKDQRPAHDDMVAQRREAVATLRNRMLSVREIVQVLGTPPKVHAESKFFILNPQTGSPYSLATIQSDLAYLKKRAIKNADKEISEWRALQLEEIREARKLAWAYKDLNAIHRFLKLEMQLLGTLGADMSIENNLIYVDASAKESLEKKLEALVPKLADQNIIEGKIIDGDDKSR